MDIFKGQKYTKLCKRTANDDACKAYLAKIG